LAPGRKLRVEVVVLWNFVKIKVFDLLIDAKCRVHNLFDSLFLCIPGVENVVHQLFGVFLIM